MRRVTYQPDALDDIDTTYRYIAERSSPRIAQRYVEAIQRYIAGFAGLPFRGTKRPELGPGVRTVGFKRQVTIAFSVEDERIVIHRVLYGGRRITLK